MPIVDLLARLAGGFRKAGAKRFMPLHQQIKAGFKCSHVYLAIDLPEQGYMVIRRARLRFLQQIEPFLGKRQWYQSAWLEAYQRWRPVLESDHRAGGIPKTC